MSRKKIVPVVDSDIKLIRKANEFIEARYKFDIWETRVFAYMLTLIKYSDTDFTEYKINVGDIVREFGLNRGGMVYDEIKKASDKLLSKKVQIERTTTEGVVEILDTHLVVSTARPKDETKDNYIKLSFHPSLKPFLLELKQRYLVYDIRNILSLTSIYSIRLFELLKQYQKIGKRRFLVDELKQLLSIEPDEYVLYGHFKDRVIKKAQKDLLENTDIYCEFEEESVRKRVYAITFYIYANKKNERIKPEIEGTKNKTPDKKIVKETPKEENPIIEQIFEKVNKFVSKGQVKKWIAEVPVEQIENAINYTENYIRAGNKVANIGGFLNTMVHTPNLFDKFEEKKTKAKKVTKKQQEISGQVEIKKVELQQIWTDLDKATKELEISIFEQNPTLHEVVIDKMKTNPFYDHKKTILENLQRESIKGLRSAILKEMFPEYNDLLGQFDKKLKVIKGELQALGYRD
jgi:plasmid replication initiation protein